MRKEIGEHPGRVVEHLVGRELDRPDPLGHEPPVADGVVRPLTSRRMSSMAADLHDEAQCSKEEIDPRNLGLLTVTKHNLTLGFWEMSGPHYRQESSFEPRCHGPTHGTPVEYLVEEADTLAPAAAQRG